MRNLVLILSDQLDLNSANLQGFDKDKDMLWMAETQEEATRFWSHKLRIALFFSGMRHFRTQLQKNNFPIRYHEMPKKPSDDYGKDMVSMLRKDIKKLNPQKIIMTLPGSYWILETFQKLVKDLGIRIKVHENNHFYCKVKEFNEYASGKKKVLMENFYRHMRKNYKILLKGEKEPIGGKWNFDHENRNAFGPKGPGEIPFPHSFQPDRITSEVIEMVKERFHDHPGKLDYFDLPVTQNEAYIMLQDFIENRLPNFGTYEDAMWTDQPFLYHSRLSTSLNMKLLNPRDCVREAIKAYESGYAPLNSVEAFIRQILGWREFIRGIYWLHMPQYWEMNYFGHNLDVPSFFWDGETEMECVRQTMKHIINHGYAHHIHRLMVMGLLAQLLGIHPQRFHKWHMAMYLDAGDWVSLPNALGMSQYGDGGIVGTKPYIASGGYINRMSNFCRICCYNYQESSGDNACPFTTFYWDFLDRHSDILKKNPRMMLQIRNLENKKSRSDEMKKIRNRSEKYRQARKF